ncbi:uncharacterized protein LOC134262638 [Saccostrea cucullata]|uniref:uncharacterized protein LOC134262638 n=1 Tax=Saccostrea cuccullata TaxID=36930 RepID=UPI002ED3E6B2
MRNGTNTDQSGGATTLMVLVILMIVMLDQMDFRGPKEACTFNYSTTELSWTYYRLYDTLEPVLFSYCLRRCKDADRCTVFTYKNLTSRCKLFDVSSYMIQWHYTNSDSCSYCLSGWKSCPMEPEEHMPEASTSVIAPTTTETREPLCKCLCKESNASIDEILNERLSKLSLNKTELSSTKRKLSCAENPRPSAKDVGYFGVCGLMLVVGIIVIFDFLKILSYCASLRCHF